jgi:hypothetical protein
MQTIGPASVQIFASILCLRPTLSRWIPSASAAHHQLLFPHRQKICLTSGACACLPRPPPLLILIIWCTHPSPSMARTRLVSNTSQITPFDLGLILSLEPVMSTPHGHYTIQMSPLRRASYRNLTGLCTDLTTAISPRR